jgi:hypothetical protein
VFDIRLGTAVVNAQDTYSPECVEG